MSLIKNKREIALLKKAAEITVKISKAISEKIKPGAGEKDIVKEIEARIKNKGLKRSFRTIVASGPNSAKPHARPTTRRIENNDIVVIDFGVVYKGYHADMTRTYIIGNISPKMKSLYKTVKTAQRKAIKKIKAGIKISRLSKDINDYMRDRGFGKHILHSLGHGIGLKIHEAPKLSEKNKKILKKGIVCTVEPGLYIKGRGGARIEDMVLVRNQGAEVLTA